jgi:hypothetical protein
MIKDINGSAFFTPASYSKRHFQSKAAAYTLSTKLTKIRDMIAAVYEGDQVSISKFQGNFYHFLGACLEIVNRSSSPIGGAASLKGSLITTYLNDILPETNYIDILTGGRRGKGNRRSTYKKRRGHKARTQKQRGGAYHGDIAIMRDSYCIESVARSVCAIYYAVLRYNQANAEQRRLSTDANDEPIRDIGIYRRDGTPVMGIEAYLLKIMKILDTTRVEGYRVSQEEVCDVLPITGPSPPWTPPLPQTPNPWMGFVHHGGDPNDGQWGSQTMVQHQPQQNIIQHLVLIRKEYKILTQLLIAPREGTLIETSATNPASLTDTIVYYYYTPYMQIQISELWNETIQIKGNEQYRTWRTGLQHMYDSLLREENIIIPPEIEEVISWFLTDKVIMADGVIMVPHRILQKDDTIMELLDYWHLIYNSLQNNIIKQINPEQCERVRRELQVYDAKKAERTAQKMAEAKARIMKERELRRQAYERMAPAASAPAATPYTLSPSQQASSEVLARRAYALPVRKPGQTGRWPRRGGAKSAKGHRNRHSKRNRRMVWKTRRRSRRTQA